MIVKSGYSLIILSLVLSSLMSPVQGFWDLIFPPNEEIAELEQRIDELEARIIELEEGPVVIEGPPGPQGLQGETGWTRG